MAHPDYSPNHVSLDRRAAYLVVSALIIAYAVGSLMRNDFYIWLPLGRRSGPIEEHLHGAAAWLAAASAMSAAANLLSVVVDHYDKRNNEKNYRAVALWSFRLSVVLLIAALIVNRYA